MRWALKTLHPSAPLWPLRTYCGPRSKRLPTSGLKSSHDTNWPWLLYVLSLIVRPSLSFLNVQLSVFNRQFHSLLRTLRCFAKKKKKKEKKSWSVCAFAGSWESSSSLQGAAKDTQHAGKPIEESHRWRRQPEPADSRDVYWRLTFVVFSTHVSRRDAS